MSEYSQTIQAGHLPEEVWWVPLNVASCSKSKFQYLIYLQIAPLKSINGHSLRSLLIMTIQNYTCTLTDAHHEMMQKTGNLVFKDDALLLYLNIDR